MISSILKLHLSCFGELVFLNAAAKAWHLHNRSMLHQLQIRIVGRSLQVEMIVTVNAIKARLTFSRCKRRILDGGVGVFQIPLTSADVARMSTFPGTCP